LAGEHGRVVIVAVEAPSRYLRIEPGPAGETAALFGDGAAVVVVGTQSASGAFPTIGRIHFWTDGSASDAFRIRLDDRNRLAAHMDGSRLAAAAIHAMAATLNEVLEANRIGIHALQAIVVHGGNGRLPELLARHLSYPPERVWSETTTTSNLGAASIPVAWQSRQPVPTGVIAWLAVAPGLTCAATLLGVRG
jgi:3-oxoacyl-[acyl-carrier-protein] synthase-3